MRRASGLGLVAAVVLALPAAAQAPVLVEPLVGNPETAFHVEVDAAYPIRQARDMYWFRLDGPGGRRCETTVTTRVGVAPPRSARRVFADLAGVRVVNRRELVPGPWCPGVFRGRVAFRDWRPRARRYVIHRIGSFQVEVREEG